MIRKYKNTLIFTSLLTLLPIVTGLLLWNRFPDSMAIHYGITGEPDGYASAPVAVFLMPLLLLVTQWICFYFTAWDKGNRNRNQKVMQLVLWIIPVLSNLVSGLMYALALGKEPDVISLMLAAMGLLFVVIGNYLPKTRMNATIGIKIPWTYTSEENWNATHRMAGKLWVAGGILIMLSGILPEKVANTVFLITLFVMILVPILYSRQFWKKQKAEGLVQLKEFPKWNSGAGKASLAAVAVVLILTGLLMFCGNIRYDFQADCVKVDADLYTDYVIYYDSIEDVQLRPGNVEGVRIGGWGSARLLMGNFKNEEFGNHIRYTYGKPEACVVLTVRGKTVVLSGETAAETEALYKTLMEKTGK